MAARQAPVTFDLKLSRRYLPPRPHEVDRANRLAGQALRAVASARRQVAPGDAVLLILADRCGSAGPATRSLFSLRNRTMLRGHERNPTDLVNPSGDDGHGCRERERLRKQQREWG
jgi:hypothetical protein